MTTTALPGGLPWQRGTVVELVAETERAGSIILDVPGRAAHTAGQHVDIRVGTKDGHQAQRSYWIASAPEDGYLVVTVERVAGGVVSSYLVNDVRVGDQVELRGPVGDLVTWDDSSNDPVLLVAGGSGIVPFRSMLRHALATNSNVPIRLLYSARTLDDVIYYDELMRHAAYDEIDVRLTLTHSWPQRWRGHRGPLDHTLLGETAWPARDCPMNLVCGPSRFVDAAASLLVTLGHPRQRIKTERFGPS